jgi:hypothetical protein
MSGTKPTKATLEQRARSLIAGTQKHFPNATLAFAGATFTTAALVQILQSLIDVIAGADTAHASWEDALKSMEDGKAKSVPIVRAYQSYVVNRFGNAPSMLADFGIEPRKSPAPLTAEQKAAAAAKRLATRQARHTMGKRQRAKVKAPAIAPATGTPPKPAT